MSKQHFVIRWDSESLAGGLGDEGRLFILLLPFLERSLPLRG